MYTFEERFKELVSSTDGKSNGQTAAGVMEEAKEEVLMVRKLLRSMLWSLCIIPQEFPVVCRKTKPCVLGTLANTSLMRPSKEIKNEAWFSQATQVQAFVAYANENERRHRHQNQPRHPPFCLNPQTRGIWNECFNWPDVQVLISVANRREMR